MQATVNQIEIKIKNHKRGKIFFIEDFTALGTPEGNIKIPRASVTQGVAIGLGYGGLSALFLERGR